MIINVLYIILGLLIGTIIFLLDLLNIKKDLESLKTNALQTRLEVANLQKTIDELTECINSISKKGNF